MLDRFGNFEYRCACPVCLSKGSFLAIGNVGKGFSDQRLVMCKKCSHIMHNPYSIDVITKYKDDTYSASERGSAHPTTSYLSDSYASSSNKIDRITELLPNPSNGVVFDFGCGAGTLIKAFKERGYEARGTEISTGFWEYAHNQGYDVARTANMDNQLVSQWIGESNILSMIHVIEHLEYPSEALNTLFDLSPSDAILMIEYPDYWRAVDRGSMFNPETYFHEYHLHDFSFLSMKMLLESHGFRILQVDTWDSFPKDKNVLITATKDSLLKRDYHARFREYLPSESSVYERYVTMKSVCDSKVSW